MLAKLKHFLQTKWVDRYTPEPVYIQVRETAIGKLEEAVVRILADPGTQFTILEEDRLGLLSVLSEISGKPRGWYLVYIFDELRRRRHEAAGEVC